jgi:cytochrome c
MVIRYWRNRTIKEENPAFTFVRPGIYKPVLKIKDESGKEASFEPGEILVGNDPPKVAIEVTGNRSFYWDHTSLNYRVKVIDKEDGSLEKGTIPENKVTATFSYIPYGKDIVEAAESHQVFSANVENKGKKLVDGSDCKACHAIDKTSVGPAFIEVAKRYKTKEGSVQYLAEKIRKGGGGKWGHREMAAHPQVTEAEAEQMVKYILALSSPEAGNTSVKLPLHGTRLLNQHIGQGEEGAYIFMASYRGKGGQKIGPLSGRSELILKHPKLYATEVDSFQGAAKASNGDAYQVKYTEDKAYVLFRNIDLTGISQVSFEVNPANSSGNLEIRVGSKEGKLVGSTACNFGSQ